MPVSNQQEVQEGRLNSMWDFDTSSEKVQDIQSDYLAKLYKMGGDRIPCLLECDHLHVRFRGEGGLPGVLRGVRRHRHCEQGARADHGNAQETCRNSVKCF